MKKQEYLLVVIIGLFLLAYVLDAVVDPLSINLVSPYHYFNPKILTLYPFTTTSIVIKAIGLFITCLWLLSFMGTKYQVKGAILLAVSGLMQLYALQDVATNAQVIPLEWSLSFTLAGVALLLPAILFIVIGLFKQTHKSLQEEPKQESEP